MLVYINKSEISVEEKIPPPHPPLYLLPLPLLTSSSVSIFMNWFPGTADTSPLFAPLFPRTNHRRMVIAPLVTAKIKAEDNDSREDRACDSIISNARFNLPPRTIIRGHERGREKGVGRRMRVIGRK